MLLKYCWALCALFTLTSLYASTPIPIDVILMGGQSNATGQGRVVNIPQDFTIDTRVLIYYSPRLRGGQTTRTLVPLRSASETPARFGAELSMGTSLQKAFPDRKFAIIKHALSGSNLVRQWNPGNRPNETQGAEYRIFMTTVLDGLAALRAAGYEPTLRAMTWQQGCADAHEENNNVALTTAKSYEANLTNLIATIRSSLGTPNLLFVHGQVMPMAPVRFVGRDQVRLAQKEIAESIVIENAAGNAMIMSTANPIVIGGVEKFTANVDPVPRTMMVYGDDLQMLRTDNNSANPNDDAHLGSQGQLDLGERYALAISTDMQNADGSLDKGSVATLVAGGQTWTDSLFTPSWINDAASDATLHVPENAQFSFDRAEGAVIANQVYFAGRGALTLSATTLPTITTLDFNAMQGATTVDFNTGATNLIAGTNTTLAEAGSGVLTVGVGKRATLHNTLWPEAKILRSSTGLIAYLADSSEPVLTAVPFKTVSNANVLIRRPVNVPDTAKAVRFDKSGTYTFQDTTFEMWRLITSFGAVNTSLTLDHATMTVRDTTNAFPNNFTIGVGYSDSDRTIIKMINDSKLSATGAVVYLGWGRSNITFTATDSTLDVRGIQTGRNNATANARPCVFTLDNSTLKLREGGFHFGHVNSVATFKDALVYAEKSTSINSVGPIQVKGSVTLAALAGQTLTVSTSFANTLPNAPAAFTLGTVDYTGVIKLDATARPSIAHINAPLVIVPSSNEDLTGRITFPTTLLNPPEASITIEGRTAKPTMAIEEGANGSNLILTYPREITLVAGGQTWTDSLFTPNWINGATSNARVHVPEDAQFSFDRAEGAVVANQVAFVGDGALTLSATTLPTITTLDFTAMQGATTVDFNTGAANLIAGTNTTLTEAGSGVLTVGVGKRATLHNTLWPEAKILRSSTGLVAYSADSSEPVLTALPFVTVANANVLFKRPMKYPNVAGKWALVLGKHCTYTFQDTTVEMMRLITSLHGANTNVTLNNATMAVTDKENNIPSNYTASIGHSEDANAIMNVTNKSTFAVPNAILFLGWELSNIVFTVTDSTLDVGGLWTGKNTKVPSANARRCTFTLNNSVLKLKGHGFDFGHVNSVATFKDTQVYAQASTSIKSVGPIRVEGAVTLAALAGQTLTVNANFADTLPDTPATFILGTPEYAGTIHIATGTTLSNAVSVRTGKLTGTGSITGTDGVVFADGVTLGGALRIDNATFNANLTLDTNAGVPTITTLTIPTTGTRITLVGSSSTTETLINWTTKPAYAHRITCTNMPIGRRLVANDTGLALAPAITINVGNVSNEIRDYIASIAETDVDISQREAEKIYLFGLTKVTKNVSFRVADIELSADATIATQVTLSVTTDTDALPSGGVIKGILLLKGGTALDAIDTPLNIVLPTTLTVNEDRSIGFILVKNVPLTQGGKTFSCMAGAISTK